MAADNVSWPRRQLNYSVAAMLLPERLVDSFGMRCNALARITFYAHGVFAPNSKHRVRVTPAKVGSIGLLVRICCVTDIHRNFGNDVLWPTTD